MNRYGVQAAAAVVMAATAVTSVPMTAQAADNYELRKKVVQLAGITGYGTTGEYVTRGNFAQMLVNATAYKIVGTGASGTAVFADVAAGSEYASAIRVAAENGWMTGYLGGAFRPDQQITLQEAARGILALLGYTNEDFSGNQIGGRWAQFQKLELNENINKQAAEILTQEDCVNLFYNLLRTETKNGPAYCTTLGYELSSDGEVNPLTIADNELKGPKVVRKSESIDDYLPFKASEATFYLNGEYSSFERVKQEKQSEGFLVIYYNTTSKTVWAYSSADNWSEGTVGQVAVKGTVSGIFYNSSDVMTPSVVMLEDGDDVQFKLGSSDVQFGFSIYGDVKVGDDVILLCEATGGSEGNMSYTVIDYVKY